MPDFEDIKPGARLRGLDPAGIAEVVQVARFGPDALNLVFRVDGRVGERLVYRGEESGFEFVEAGRSYAFDADGGLLRLASEAYRIRLAYLFDPYLAVSASQIEALPHQITAVYGEMLPRQPLRFLLADDPGAGKTIMAGLLIKELLIRGDLERCLIVAPGSLVEQWQDEMSEKFGLGFDILTRDQIEASVTGNPFVEKNRLIVRLDMAARSDELKAKLQAAPDWDLIICDEAHRMAASYFGGEVKETQRHKLGKLLGHPNPELPADVGDAAQRQGSRLPALHGAARRRPFRRAVSRGRSQGRRVRHDASAHQRGTLSVRRHAAVSRTPRLHGELFALACRRPISIRR